MGDRTIEAHVALGEVETALRAPTPMSSARPSRLVLIEGLAYKEAAAVLDVADGHAHLAAGGAGRQALLAKLGEAA